MPTSTEARPSMSRSPSHDFAKLRLASSESSRSQYTLQHPKPLAHRRAFSHNFSSPPIRLPLPRRDTEPPRRLPPMLLTPPPSPRLRIVTSVSPAPSAASAASAASSSISISSTSTTNTSSTRSVRTRKVLINSSLAAHLQKGGVISITGKDGKRVRMYLPATCRL